MKKNPDSKRVLVNLRADVRAWIEAQARYRGATITAIVTMAIRDAMEREAAKDRSKPAAAAE
jgi:hypothetical protein